MDDRVGVSASHSAQRKPSEHKPGASLLNKAVHKITIRVLSSLKELKLGS